MAKAATVKEQPEWTVDDVIAEDYSQNMFSEGHNRTARAKNDKSASGYDEAAHTTDADASDYGEAQNAEQLLDSGATPDTFHSRDGTDASGRDDESGGFIGGTTKEVDSLEASGAPVDKTPQMKR